MKFRDRLGATPTLMMSRMMILATILMSSIFCIKHAIVGFDETMFWTTFTFFLLTGAFGLKIINLQAEAIEPL